ncbi:hypothetical protein [Amphibacillus sediminis]|uniref:hypothetical protein n=1 Tax=Amphibacillus sediminis TaxID=360185 RepID=UPI000833FA81|nr:hypothetical protein [Amphibacillus sediminis]
MKHMLKMISFSFILVALVACGGSNADKGNVEITFPASFYEGVSLDEEELQAEADEEGMGEVKVNDDGSITYSMPKEMHDDLLETTAAELKTSFEEIVEDEDFPSIQDITYNDDFTEFTLIVDQELFENSFDGFAVMSVGFSGMIYQVYEGKGDDVEVVVNYQNVETGDVFETVKFPEDME